MPYAVDMPAVLSRRDERLPRRSCDEFVERVMNGDEKVEIIDSSRSIQA
jgi:hypothetical protein